MEVIVMTKNKSHTQFTPESKLVIDTVVDNWLDLYDRRLLNNVIDLLIQYSLFSTYHSSTP